MIKTILSILLISVLGFLVACKKNKDFTKNHLDFSNDTLLFDTVFTTVGSTTKRFKIYNRNLSKINIDEIQLMGGESSPFRINIDGVPGDYHEDVEIEGGDSLFAFVEVTLQVNNTTNPLVISDSVRFLTNGLNQYLNLDVWGQDAYFHAPAPGENLVLVGDEIEPWNNDKPHVLYGLVAVDSAKQLTIPGGTDIFCHKDSRLLIYKGTLDIQGTLGNEVTFQGDRLESFYDDIAGQWWGIHLIAPRTSSIQYANIKNGSVGLRVDSTSSESLTLDLGNTIIDNSSFYNLNLVAGPIVDIENCLFGKAGISSAFLFAGGTYRFKHCNFVNYWPGGRNSPAFSIQNYYTFENTIFVSSIIDSRFDNCIFYGNADTEFVVDTLTALTNDFIFNACLIKREEIYDYDNYTSILWNEDPLFVDPFSVDFKLNEDSPCRDAGDALFSNAADIEGMGRGIPDIGLYEF